MRRFRLYLIGLLICLFIVGCNPSKESTTSDDSYRIISLMPSNTEILYALDLGTSVVGVTDQDDYPKDVQSLPQFNTYELNAEALLKLKPTHIVTHEIAYPTQQQVLDQLKKEGVEIITVEDATTIDEVYDTFNQVATPFDRTDKSEQLVEETKSQVQAVLDDIPSSDTMTRVYYEVSLEPERYTSGRETLHHDMIAQLKAKNIYEDLKGWQSIALESLVEKNPDIYLHASDITEEDLMNDIQGNNALKKINAVQNDKVYVLDPDILNRPTPRIDEALKLLRDHIYEAS